MAPARATERATPENPRRAMTGRRARRRLGLVGAVLLGLLGCDTWWFEDDLPRPPVVFTAAGDFGATGEAAATLRSMPASGAAFNLTLGDLSYGSLRPESAWCDFVTEHVGPEFPFQLLAGNHDVDGGSPGEHIDEFVRCLPNRLDGLQGQYGRRYFVDHPATRPVARIIMVSPNALIGGQKYSYLPGSDGYRWLVRAVEQARRAGIRWVVVGSHQPCLSVGRYPCEMGADLFNLLVQQRVDLVLTGHDHNYQRSKQLRLGPGCPAVVPDVFDEDCLAPGQDGQTYTRGAGPVQLVVGTGGVALTDLAPDDPEMPYMAALSGANREPTHGAVRLSITERGLSGEFLPVGGEFEDRFTIVDDGADLPDPPRAPRFRSFVAEDAVWRYFDGDRRPAGWERPGFDDSSWTSGRAELGYGDGDESTVIDFGDDPDLKPVTAYFRHTFTVRRPERVTSLRLYLARDDGAVVHLNGVPVQTSNMPEGAVDHTTRASVSVDDVLHHVAEVDPSLLRAGRNTLAVEVHQADPASSDLSFSLAMAGRTRR